MSVFADEPVSLLCTEDWPKLPFFHRPHRIGARTPVVRDFCDCPECEACCWYGSAISIDDNAASSLARGNVAENKMTLSGGAGTGDYPGGGETPMLARAMFVPVSAGAVLANRQVNDGGVAAKTVTGNSGVASAYGNSALNSATGEGMGQPRALVSNVQVNRGPVTASVIGQFGAAMTGGVSASLVTVSGNSLAATAIGNQAVNAITISR